MNEQIFMLADSEGGSQNEGNSRQSGSGNRGGMGGSSNS